MAVEEKSVSVTDRDSGAYGIIDVYRYDAESLEALHPQFPDLSDKRQLKAAELFRTLSEQQTRNTVCQGLHEYNVTLMDRNADIDTIEGYLALGDDNNTTPAYTDTTLNNERFRKPVTEFDPDGTDMIFTTFVDATEANSMDAVREVGIVLEITFSGGTGVSEFLCNHSLVSPEPKSSSVALIFGITIGFLE